MKQLRLTPRASFVYYESSKNPEGIGSVSNKYKPSQKLAFCACISSTIRAVIHIAFDYHVSYNCFNEPFAVSPCEDLYWDMHGLIFETSIWLLAGSTRFYQKRARAIAERRPVHSTSNVKQSLSIWSVNSRTLRGTNESKNLDSLERRDSQPTLWHLDQPRMHKVTESRLNVAP